VLDFGVARAALRTEMTRGEKIKGKVSYMAPEQLAGTPVTRHADIYAAAVILWELLAGRRLFQRSNPQALVVDKLFRSQFARPSAMNEHVSRAVDAIVLKGLAREPQDRYATARDMALALETAGRVATLSEVGEWVERMARDSLAARARLIADCESCSLVAAEEIRTPAAPSMSPLVASIEPPEMTPPPSASRESAPPSDSDAPTPRRTPLSVRARVRRSLASLLEPDLESKLVAHVRRLAFERRRTLGAAAALATCFALSAVVVRTLASRGSTDAEPAQASAVRAEPARTLSVIVEPTRACPNGMATIPGGTFFMGSDEDPGASRPAHRVSLSPYCMDLFEVTTEGYKACSDRGECKHAGVVNEWAGVSGTERRTYDPLCNARDPMNRGRHPINCVDWEMAQTYCAARGARLPTEAEWELAARGNEGRRYPWGDAAPSARLLNACGKECVEWGRRNHTEESALFTDGDGWATTAPVGSFPEGQSRYGVQDLVGNVWEWVADNWGPYSPDAVDDPRGSPSGRERVIRGGGWNGAYAGWMRATFRYHDPPDTKSYGIGFRCAADQGAYATDARER
jgi:formylglycine-generating enzyme required for sulfatase activity